MKSLVASSGVVPLNQYEIDVVAGGNDCAQDVVGVISAGAGVVAVVMTPLTMGLSLVAAGLFGLAAGIMAAQAADSCS